MEQYFTFTFSKYIKADDLLILAVSGGVDSMVLLDLIVKNHPREKIVVAHFDHCLRGVESDGDREFVRDYCKQKHITFEVGKLDITELAREGKMSVESAARKYRYDFLFRVAERYSSRYILTAHHADDRIETAMFNLIRGSKLGGLHALSRFTIHDSQFTIFRPLLGISKGEIVTYAKDKKITYQEDSTNAKIDYQRNYLRHEVLPKLAQINPEYRVALTNFIEYTEDLKEWIDDEITNFLSGKNEFSVKDFEKKSPFFQKEIIRYLYERANSGTIGLTEGNIEEMLRFILTANGGTEKRLGRLDILKKFGMIHLY